MLHRGPHLGQLQARKHLGHRRAPALTPDLHASVEQELIGFNWRQGKVTGTRRTGRLVPSDLSVRGETDGIRLSFSLPKGGYATAVLREVMKVGNPDLAED